MKTKRQRQEEALSRREKDLAKLSDVIHKAEAIIASNGIGWLTYGDTMAEVTVETGPVILALFTSKVGAAERDIANLKAKLS